MAGYSATPLPVDMIADLDAAGVKPGMLDAEELIRRAEVDIDNFIGPLPIGNNGRKYDPGTLEDFQADALRFATLAQCAYRVLQGEEAMAEADDTYRPR